MSAWWEALTIFQQVFVCVAIPSTLIMVLQFILTLIGIGGEADADADFDTDTDFDTDADLDLDADGDADVPDGDLDGIEGPDSDGFNFGFVFRLFTLRGMIAFLAVMGWMGYALDGTGLPRFATVLISVGSGFAIMVILALIMQFFTGLQSNGNIDIRNALGQSGNVYLKIPAARQGSGKVTVIVQNKFDEYEAVTDESEPIPYGTEVVVIAISGGDTLVVKKK